VPAAPTVSFIIPTYGRAAMLQETIRCALAQDYADFEIVVATQDPDPPSFLDEWVALNPVRLQVLHRPAPNANAARNAAVQAARGSLLLSIDDDVRFGPDYAARHAARYADPRVGFVMSLTRRRDGEPVAEVLAHHAALLELPAVPRPGDFVPIAWAPTCSTSFRREAIVRAGWFDPYFTGGVADDTDIAVRIGAAGYAGFLDTTIELTHLAASSGGFGTRDPARTHVKELNDQRMRLYFAAKNRVHLGRASTLRLFASALRSTLGICRRRYGLAGALLAPWTFARLAWRAVRDARHHL
jgi:glycosyltransferase involved in cell wall biosynthesis